MEESLVARRSRRSTAGNRMAVALAEMVTEDSLKEAEDDNDFVVDKFEEDIAPSDFESTDEEEEQKTAEGEQETQREERQVRKSAKSRLEKATAAAHARQKATFNPEAQPSAPVVKPRTRKRATLGPDEDEDADTGERIGPRPGKRKSKRKHTILSTSLHIKRIKEEELKSSKILKKPVTPQRVLTQDELIARALDNEEGNLIEHRDYLKIEEEKRRKARVERVNLQGGLVKFVSLVEQVEVTVPPSTSSYPYPYGSYSAYPSLFSFPTANGVGSSSNPYMSLLTSAPFTPQKRKEKVTKNYVVHELGQSDGVIKPTWSQTMGAMFGNEVNWEDFKVYSGKGRPLSRPKVTCPITGQTAKYFDPRTGVPYANVAAFKVLTSILNHEYVWSNQAGCYIRKEDRTNMMDTS